MLNLNSIMVGTSQLKVMGDFYEKVFAKKPDMEDGDFRGWLVGNTFISVGAHSEVKGKAKEPARMMFNLETEQVKEEFERISKFATVIKAPYEMGGASIATLADPDGNYFQLMTPWKSN